jgi:hypothetical protein
MQPYQLKAGGNQIAILVRLKPATANFLMIFTCALDPAGTVTMKFKVARPSSLSTTICAKFQLQLVTL